MKWLPIFVVLLFSATIIFAQARPRPERLPALDTLQTTLGLTDQQVSDLEALRRDTHAAMQALRAEPFGQQKDRREAARAILEAQKDQMAEILNEEQMAQWSAQRPKRGPKLSESEQEALKTELRAYREEQIEPVLRQQRAKLDAHISPDNQALIEALRTTTKAAERNERHQALRSHQEDLQYLLKTYGADIRALLAEIEPQEQQWQADLKAIHEKYLSVDEGRTRATARRAGHDRKAKGHVRAVHFLLMDPTE